MNRLLIRSYLLEEGTSNQKIILRVTMSMHYYMHIFLLLNVLILNNFDPAYAKSMSVLEKTFKSKNSNRKSKITMTVIEIMAKCMTQATDKVIFAGDWTDFSTLHQFSSNMFTINIIGMSQTNTFKRHQRLQGSYELKEELVRKLRYPAPLFIVSVPRGPIDDLLSRIKDSVFWHAEAVFIFVDEDPRGSCSNATSTLDTAWKFNILHAIYICQHANGKILFYNFSPFADLAPAHWKMVDTAINHRRNHTFTIYQILFDNLIINHSFCDKLHFDKVSSLNGYPIRLCGIKDSLFLTEKRASSEVLRDLDDFEGIDARVSQIIWSKLQASPTLTILRESGFIDNNVPYGLIKYILDGDFDAVVNQYFFRSFWRLQTYPHGVEGLCALSRENYDSQNSAMNLWIFNPELVSIIALASFLIAVMLKYLLRISLSQASFSVFSLLLGLSTQLPKTIANRINLSYVMILMFVLNLYLSCSLTSFLVAPQHAFNVDSLDDIINNKYTAIGAAYVKEYIIDENFSKLFNVGHFDECLSKIKEGDKVACIQTCVNGIYYKNESSYLHISKSSINSLFRTFLTREDWPLRTKFNLLIQKMVETGILQYLRQAEVYKLEMNNQRKNSQYNDDFNNSHLPVKTETMTFAWYTLIAGIFFSSVSFFVELFMYTRSLDLIRTPSKMLSAKGDWIE